MTRFALAAGRRVARVVDEDTVGGPFGLDPFGPYTFYFHPDHLGSTSTVTDHDGNFESHTTYHPYGSLEAQQGAFEPDYLYTDKERDENTGLVYFGARYYWPELGRWLSADPLFLQSPAKALESPLELNLYSYASNSSVTAIDRAGLNTVWLGGAGFESETQAYSVPITDRLKAAGVPQPEYVPISTGLGQPGNVATILGSVMMDAPIEAQRPAQERVIHASNAGGGSRNLVGYSYGAVAAAHAALALANQGIKVDSVVLLATPMSPESSTYKRLVDHPNIGGVTRIDIKGDPFSAGIDPGKMGDMERHFHFIENDRGQQDWLVETVKQSVEQGDSIDHKVIEFDPTTEPAGKRK